MAMSVTPPGAPGVPPDSRTHLIASDQTRVVGPASPASSETQILSATSVGNKSGAETVIFQVPTEPQIPAVPGSTSGSLRKTSHPMLSTQLKPHELVAKARTLLDEAGFDKAPKRVTVSSKEIGASNELVLTFQTIGPVADGHKQLLETTIASIQADTGLRCIYKVEDNANGTFTLVKAV